MPCHSQQFPCRYLLHYALPRPFQTQHFRCSSMRFLCHSRLSIAHALPCLFPALRSLTFAPLFLANPRLFLSKQFRFISMQFHAILWRCHPCVPMPLQGQTIQFRGSSRLFTSVADPSQARLFRRVSALILSAAKPCVSTHFLSPPKRNRSTPRSCRSRRCRSRSPLCFCESTLLGALPMR